MRIRGKNIPLWGVLLSAVVCVALLVRLVGYNFSLPYVDHPDEPIFYLTGLEWRGLFDLGNNLRGYPPLYIWLNIGVQGLLGILGIHGLSVTVGVLRLISLGFSLATLASIMMTARLGANWFAGIVAGLAWAVAPLVVQNAIYAIPDPLVYLVVNAALLFAAVALVDSKHSYWGILSVAAGCLAILAKYYVLTAVLPGLIVAFQLYRRDRKRGRRVLAVQVLLLIITAAISIPGIAVLGREGATARASGMANVLDLSRVLNNIFQAFQPLNAPFFLITLALGVLAYAIARRDQRVCPQVVALCLLILISVPWLAAAFSLVSPTERMKDVLPATTAACVLLGLGAAQLIRLTPRLLRVVVVIVPLVLVFAPQVNQDIALMQDRVRPDTRVALRQWADTNLRPGTVLVGSENEKTFNPYWGGLEAAHWFDWIVTKDFMAKPPQAWQQQNGISYIVLSRDQWQQMQATPAGQAYLAPMLYLRSLFLPQDRGPQMVVYRLWAMQHSTQVKFGGSIELLGYDLDDSVVSPGGSATLTFYWRADSPPADNYSVFVHLLPQGGSSLITQADGAPARPERPTLTWTNADETLISQPFVLTIPSTTTMGLYDIQIGLYNYLNDVRLAVTAQGNAAQDALRLTTITIA